MDNSAAVKPANGAVGEKRKKKSFFKAAIVMLRGKPATNTKKQLLPPSIDAPQNWQKIVGSIRPFTLQEEEEDDAIIMADARLSPKQKKQYSLRRQHLRSFPSMDSFEDAMVAPNSPSCSSTSGSMSQYASATNLHAMDVSSDEDDEDAALDGKPADDMIDAKAEEFIANFYAQMRRQR